MKFNKILIVSILLLALLAIAPICANDNTTTDKLSANDANLISDSNNIDSNDILKEMDDKNSDDILGVDEGDEENEKIDFKVTKPKQMYTDEPTKIKFKSSGIPSGKIKVTIDKKTYTGSCDFGTGYVKIKALTPGTKTVTYSGKFDDGYTSGSFKINVVKKPTVKAKDLTMFSTQTKKYKVRLLDGNKKPLAGKSITFYKDYKKLKTVKTDKNGYASIKISKSAAGKFKLKVKYDTLIFAKKLTVKSVFKSFKTAKVKNAKKLSLTLATKKINGKYLKGKTVRIKVINKNYKAKINEKGIVKLTIPQKRFVKCDTDKDSYYFADAYLGKDTKWVAIQFSKVKPTLSYKLYTKLPWVGGV